MNRPRSTVPSLIPADQSGGSEEEPTIPTGRWAVDPARSTITFVATHLLVSKVTGTFSRIAGAIETTVDPVACSVRAIADAASLTTGDAARDAHLLSADFFDVERWPIITLDSTGLRSGQGRHELDTILTIRQISQPVTFDVTAALVDQGHGPASRHSSPDHLTLDRPVARFTAEAIVNRKDFGLRWNAAIETGSVVVGDMVTLALVAIAEMVS